MPHDHKDSLKAFDTNPATPFLKKWWLPSVAVILLAIALAIIGILRVQGSGTATTIGANISTGGTLRVSGGVYASSTLQVTGDATFYGNTNLGTVNSGTWNGTAIGSAYGGTGQNFSGSTGLISLNSGTATAVATSSLNLTTSSFLSSNISQWTNNSGYITGIAQLGMIGDVSTSTLAYGHLPVWNGTKWQDTATSSLKINTSDLINGAGFLTGNQSITLSGPITGSGATSILTQIATSSFDYWVNNSTGVTGNPYLVTVGTIGTGIWQGTAIATQYGGTGQDFHLSTGLISLNSGVASAVATSSLNLTVSAFASPNVSQWTNNANYIALTSLSSTATGLTYNNTTGVFSLTSGYEIPTSASSTNWSNFYYTPSTRITAGTGLSWSGNTLNGLGYPAQLGQIGDVSTSTLNYGHLLTWNGSLWQDTATTSLGISQDLSGYALLAGRAGGQTLYGGTGTGENLQLYSNTSKNGKIKLGDHVYYDDSTGALIANQWTTTATTEGLSQTDFTPAHDKWLAQGGFSFDGQGHAIFDYHNFGDRNNLKQFASDWATAIPANTPCTLTIVISNYTGPSFTFNLAKYQSGEIGGFWDDDYNVTISSAGTYTYTHNSGDFGGPGMTNRYVGINDLIWNGNVTFQIDSISLTYQATTGPYPSLIGIGTTTPSKMLTIQGVSATPLLGIYTSSYAPSLYVDANGSVGIATTSPGSLLSLNGISNFTTATSTFYSSGGINLTSGCYAINGVCLGGPPDLSSPGPIGGTTPSTGVFTDLTAQSHLGSEQLNEPDFATHTKWTPTGDLAFDGSDHLIYTYSSGSGTLTQTSGNMAVPLAANTYYTVSFVISGFSGYYGGVTVPGVTGVGTYFYADGTYTFSFLSTSTPGNFVLSFSGDSYAPASFRIVSISLKQPYAGGLQTDALSGTGGNLNLLGNVNVEGAALNYTNSWQGGPTITRLFQIDGGNADTFFGQGFPANLDTTQMWGNTVFGQGNLRLLSVGQNGITGMVAMGIDIGNSIRQGASSVMLGVHTMNNIVKSSMDILIGRNVGGYGSDRAYYGGYGNIILGLDSGFYSPSSYDISATAASGTGGLGLGSYGYAVSYIIGGITTTPSRAGKYSLTISDPDTSYVDLSIPVYDGPLPTTGKVIWRTKAQAGSTITDARLYQVATIAWDATTYQDTTPDSGLGSEPADTNNAMIIGGDQSDSPYESNFVLKGNQASIGMAITDYYFGKGPWSVAPTATTFHTTGGNGTDIAGADYIIQPGSGTGAGLGGSFKVQVAPAGSTGSKWNSFVDALVINSNGLVGIGTTSPQALLTVGSSTSAYLAASEKYNSLYVSGLMEVGGPGTSTIANNLYVMGTLRDHAIYTGDLTFGNNFSITESASDASPQELIFKNQNGEEIMKLDENGNLTIKGSLNNTSAQNSSSGLVGDVVQTVKNAFASLGMVIENGVTQFESIFAKKARIEKLEMVDQSSGEIYCTWIENGEWQKTKGECGSTATPSIQTPSTQSESSTSTSTESTPPPDLENSTSTPPESPPSS